MIGLLLIILGIVLLLVAKRKQKQEGYDYLAQYSRARYVDSMTSEQQAIDIKSLSDRSLQDRFNQGWKNLSKQLGKLALLKVMIFLVGLVFLGIEFNQRFIRGSALLVIVITVIAGVFFAYLWLKKREQTQFEESFPDALNMLSSAVSSGESITHAIMYVGNTLNNEVGKEFKIMGKRLQLGESPDDVFRKACLRFPYPSFHFFVITLRANMQRGGQLKEVILRLNRLLFNARSIEKKKYALTSEARTSAKIVAAIPIFFLFILQYLSPENYEFVMFDPSGRPILFYVLISEAIGIAIVWGLMKSVR
ncbi:TPA: type II secretion system F family protein [Vibrio metschnikovii]|uniref:type II secretion system F family protein n=1 Tax=Vibrio TaxID=662 RepID=UPI00137352A3|nr:MULTISPECIES: type II secretion system F family protein [Vibrio]EKO3566201.1 type II secretion system F family protein [Vibrio metschnikovii]EKO3626323.1 type II secretion system F family protein [Vibrio metschnikovii]EKO3770813.1 type II secretion system F family protein [Vibrio metschnikovii]EKO3791687.1 type II secretion system F family protein [Vibrio metschnikovii]NAW78685.1 pilus assembly protein TadB [Vibrio sp. V33_P6A3T137]